MSAEYCLKQYLSTLKSAPALSVSSAGTAATPQLMHPAVLGTLLALGIDPHNHKPRQLTSSLLDKDTTIIAMGKDHQDYIRRHFHRQSFLFNDLCFHKKCSVLDVNEAITDYGDNPVAAAQYLSDTVKYIYQATPALFQNLLQANL